MAPQHDDTHQSPTAAVLVVGLAVLLAAETATYIYFATYTNTTLRFRLAELKGPGCTDDTAEPHVRAVLLFLVYQAAMWGLMLVSWICGHVFRGRCCLRGRGNTRGQTTARSLGASLLALVIHIVYCSFVVQFVLRWSVCFVGAAPVEVDMLMGLAVVAATDLGLGVFVPVISFFLS